MRVPHQVVAVALTLTLGAAHAGPLQTVRVRPSGAEVPANLLRMSDEFAQPVEGAVLPRIALLRPDGTPLPQPMLQHEL